MARMQVRRTRRMQRRRFEDRSGALLIAVLICIGVVLALTMSALQTSLNQRRQLSRTLQMEQTRLLLEAAAESAAVDKWMQSQDKTDKPTPLKIELQLPTGKTGIITAAANTNKKAVLLTALIGDAENEVSVTRRSRLIGKDD